MKTSNLTKTIVITGLAIALAFVLSLVRIPFVFGTSITAASTLPIILICLHEKRGWSFATTFIYSLLHLFVAIVRDGVLSWGLISTQLIWCILLDYVLPYTLIGIMSFFKKSKEKLMILGIFLVFLLNLTCHVLSGYFIFSYFGQWNFFGKVFEGKAFLYSLCFNALHVVPEFIITTIVFLAISKIKIVKEFLFLNF